MFACFCMYIIFIVHSLKNNNSNNNNNKTKKKKRDKFGHNLFSPFSTNFPLLYSLKTSETRGFLMSTGGVEEEHWLKMG